MSGNRNPHDISLDDAPRSDVEELLGYFHNPSLTVKELFEGYQRRHTVERHPELLDDCDDIWCAYAWQVMVGSSPPLPGDPDHDED